MNEDTIELVCKDCGASQKCAPSSFAPIAPGDLRHVPCWKQDLNAGRVRRMKNPILVDVDDRGRVPLGKIAEHDRYLGSVDERGRITLVPVNLVPATSRRKEK